MTSSIRWPKANRRDITGRAAISSANCHTVALAADQLRGLKNIKAAARSAAAGLPQNPNFPRDYAHARDVVRDVLAKRS
jgi:hypothetical protein